MYSYEGVQKLRKTRPTALAKRIRLAGGERPFNSKRTLPGLVKRLEEGGDLPPGWTRDFDMVSGPAHVRCLQQAAIRDYIETVALDDRKDSATRVCEKVAVWVAETYPIIG